jgi:hypothetical protein
MGEADLEGGDLRELETMFGLWRSAGRNVNLWDWLEGFRGAMTASEEEAKEQSPNGEANGDATEEAPTNGHAEADKQVIAVDQDAMEDDEANGADLAGHAETQDRLHAAFVRFCEEARMLGLVRARGGRTARRADEVVKGIGLV